MGKKKGALFTAAGCINHLSHLGKKCEGLSKT